ncbi:MAG: dienelactone hydrolase family protein [Polyangiales bacterium]
MGTTIELTTSDGHRLSAYRADPEGKPRGGVLVIQEIFGVNAHIRSLCDDYAKEGYLAIAPALFDRIERGVETGYDGEAMRMAVGIVTKLKPGDALRDLQAAIDELSKAGKVGVVGYCYGGTMTWAAACRLERVAAASCYYGGQINRQIDAVPKVPTILHFGETDASIPLAEVDKLKAAHPNLPVYLYPAGHGFACDMRGSYHAESAKLARQRTLELFAKHVG